MVLVSIMEQKCSCTWSKKLSYDTVLDLPDEFIAVVTQKYKLDELVSPR